MATLSKQGRKSLLQAIAMIIVALATLEVTSLLQYYYSRKSILEEATKSAQNQLETTNLLINDVMVEVETAVRNNVEVYRRVISTMPDSLWIVNRRMVENNEVISGSTIAFTENYFPEKGRLFAPYAFRFGDRIDTTRLGTEAYNYPVKEWYTQPIEKKGGHWSEPYYDEGGGEMVMTTYSVPVIDEKGVLAAVLTADVSLEWLTDKVGTIPEHPGAYSILASRTGHLMVYPSPALVMNYTIQELAESSEDASVTEVAQAMLSGEKGSRLIKNKDGRKYVFYAPIDRADWSMAIVIPYKEIYADVFKVGLLVILLQLLGILLMGYILHAAIRSQKRLQEVSEKKSRIESELRIARDIQMSMVPSLFPEYEGLDMFAAMTPAKEVGGDLYGYVLQGDILYFCVGDVSGKGVPASLFMAQSARLFRTLASENMMPADIAVRMNNALAENNETGMFVTMFIGQLNLKTGHLDYCNCGHNAPVLDGEFLKMQYENQPLGLWEDDPFYGESIDDIRNKQLLVYSDGLNEAENPQQEFLGNVRLLELMASAKSLSSQQVIEMLLNAVEEHRAGADPNDDLTLLCLTIRG